MSQGAKMSSRVVSLSIGDAALSFLWVFSTSCVGFLSTLIASHSNWQGDRFPIIVSIVLVIRFCFTVMGKLLGGASWNPTTPVALYASGVGQDSLFSLAIRLPAMAVGAAAGALSAVALMPDDYKHTLGGGPRLKVDMHTGALAEGGLTFFITLWLLWVSLNGPKNGLIKTVLSVFGTLFIGGYGKDYTGPAMNPGNAFGWAYVHDRHASPEHLYVYWITPFVGAVAAGGVYKLLFTPPGAAPPERKEKAEKKE